MRIVLKVGTSSLVSDDEAEGTLLSLSVLANVVENASWLRRRGHDVVIVSSGAVGAGCHRLGLRTRPQSVAAKQALAAVGQGYLVGKYEALFDTLGQRCAQVLLTYANFSNRDQFINARNTFDELLRMGAVPIVNENDTVATQELRFGDNDRLSAMVASLISADWLFMLTDVDGLYTANPFENPSAKRIESVERMSDLHCDTKDGEGSTWGTGGMASKISAAALSTAAGVRTVIMRATDVAEVRRCCQKGSPPGVDGAAVPSSVCAAFDFPGTLFEPCATTVRGRKRWIEALHTNGTIRLDAGAVRAVRSKQSLFAAGVCLVEGSFLAQDAVRVCDGAGAEVGRGISSYSSDDVRCIMGKHSSEISDLLGYVGSGVIIERGNFVLAAELRESSVPAVTMQGSASETRSAIEPDEPY